MNVASAAAHTTTTDDEIFNHAVRTIQGFLETHLKDGHEPSSYVSRNMEYIE